MGKAGVIRDFFDTRLRIAQRTVLGCLTKSLSVNESAEKIAGSLKHHGGDLATNL